MINVDVKDIHKDYIDSLKNNTKGKIKEFISMIFTLALFSGALVTLFIMFTDALPPTKAELNCEIDTPVCVNGKYQGYNK